MRVKYKDETLQINDDFVDIGYMAESFEACDIYDKKRVVQRCNEEKSMQIFVSFPSASKEFIDEIVAFDTLLGSAEVDIKSYIILSACKESLIALKNRVKHSTILKDCQGDFAELYGVKILSGSQKGKLAKALFLISKDGAVFYIDYPDNLLKALDIEALVPALNKAYTTYTGVGCHG